MHQRDPKSPVCSDFIYLLRAWFGGAEAATLPSRKQRRPLKGQVKPASLSLRVAKVFVQKKGDT